MSLSCSYTANSIIKKRKDRKKIHNANTKVVFHNMSNDNLISNIHFLVSRLKQENHQEAAAHEDTGNEDNSCVHDSPKPI